VDKKRKTVHLREEAFNLLTKYVAEHGNTKENIVRMAIMDLVGGAREKLLKAYAPQLLMEHATRNAIFINDSEMNRMAVVKVKWNNGTDPADTITDKKINLSKPLLELYCEKCDSENCIHVRYSLLLPEILKIIN
jgi:hypothetical protein